MGPLLRHRARPRDGPEAAGARGGGPAGVPRRAAARERAADRRAAIAELTARSNAEIAAGLSADSGYTELGELDAQRAEHVGAAYRHDCVTAHRYFADALDAAAGGRLSAPVTVVVAADDPSTAEFRSRYREWQLLAEHVDLHELADGGHYFLRTRPTEAARAVLQRSRAARLSLSSN